VNINQVSSLFPSFLQPLSSTATGTSVSSAAQQTGTSPGGSFLSELQSLQQQNPDQFSQIDSQIVSKLQQVAQQSVTNGDSAQGSQLSALATQFQNAANGGQMPTMQQLEQAGLSGHHHHHGGSRGGGQREINMNGIQTPTSNSDAQNLLASMVGSTPSPLPN
jgi:hypothetical protein